MAPFKLKIVLCPDCLEERQGYKNSLCDRCIRKRYAKKILNKEKRISYFCSNCKEEKQPNLSNYCNACNDPISDKLYKFNEYNIYNKSYNENILYRYKTEGDNPLNRLLLIDAWVMITRYENKWLTKKPEEQMKLMLDELKEYNQNLYTLDWFNEQVQIVRKARREKNLSI